jgi:MFS family permease
VFAAANLLAAVAPSYALMLIARVLAALAAAAFVPAASAVASSLAPAEYRGRALATVVAGMTVAQVAGVPFGAFVGASLGWRYTFIFVGALGAAAALAVRLWLPYVQSPAPASLGRRLSVAARPSAWPLLLQTTLAMAAGFSVLTYIGPLLSQAGQYHGAMISMALLVFGVASVAGGTLGGRLTDRFGAFPVVVGGLAALTLRRCRNRGRGRRPGTARRRRFRPRPRGRARRLRPHLRCSAAPLRSTRHEKSRRVQSVPTSQFLIWLRRSQPEPALYQRKPLSPYILTHTPGPFGIKGLTGAGATVLADGPRENPSSNIRHVGLVP